LLRFACISVGAGVVVNSRTPIAICDIVVASRGHVAIVVRADISIVAAQGRMRAARGRITAVNSAGISVVAVDCGVLA
jgi:hypothetical protein